MLRKARFLGKAVFGLAAIALLGGVVMLLWNAVIPGLFTGAQPIDYGRALGLLVLSRILFGGMRGGGWHRHHHGWRGGPWKDMTPEEHERFRERFRDRFRHGGPWRRHEHEHTHEHTREGKTE